MLKYALRRLVASLVNGSPLLWLPLVSLLIVAGLVSTRLNPVDILERDCPSLRQSITESFDSILSRLECILSLGSF